MKAIVIHLSDLHLKSKGNAIFDKLDQLKGVANVDGDVFQAGFIVISGDVAFSGKSEEYTLALKLIDQLRLSLQGAGGVKEWHVVPVPGNHDCDLDADDETRKTLSESLVRNPSRTIDDSLLTNCLKVQKNYFEFCSLVTNLKFDGPKQQLFSTLRFDVGDNAIVFRCYNTAWLSSKPEKQGELLVPLNAINDCGDAGTVILSILHHPYNWFAPEPARDLQRHLENSSDIILTGHEHENEQFQKISISGHGNDYLEGGVLQDPRNPNKSSFNVILLDLDAKRHHIIQYEWSDHHYKELRRSEWKDFWRAKSHVRNAFPISALHLAHLCDPGAQFTHPQVEKLTLQHIFVPPDYRRFVYDDAKDTSTHDFVDGDNLLETLGGDKYILVTGPEKSGRSALCKVLFSTAHGKGTVPLLLHGSTLRKGLVTARDSEGLDKLIQSTFTEQYSSELYEQFRQLGKAQRALIVEDFHQCELNSNGKRSLLSRCRELFDFIWIVGDEILLIEEIQNREKKAPLYSDHRSLQIRALGRVKRERLITEWYLLGAQDTITEKELNMRIRHATQVVDTVIGKSFIPAYPIFVLTILQQIEASTSHKTASGSYGYFYEFLITRSLSKGGAARDLDLKYNYLSVLAHFCFQHERRSMTESELAQIHRAYEQDYKMQIPYERMKQDLFRSAILNQTSDGQISFHYRYVYYYFIALYFANNLHEPTTTVTLQRLAKGIHKEEFANILIFLSYLSKAPAILDAILSEAKDLYPNLEISKLGTDVQYLNQMQARVPDLILETSDPKENRKRLFGAIDRDEALKGTADGEGSKDEDQVADDKAVQEIIRINKAFKTIEVLGQILKNYTGSLKGDKKLMLAHECCCLGLRTMEFIIRLIDENLQPIISLFTERLRERRPNVTDNDLVGEAKGFLFMMSSLWAFSTIKRISHAIGSDQLEQTYAELEKQLDVPSVRMVNFATKMEHFPEFPEQEAFSLAKDLKDNYFAVSILKHLVVSHFYLFSVDHSIRERVCKRLGIPLQAPKALDERTKIT